MNLKRAFSLSFEPELGEFVDQYKRKSGLSYNEIFIKAIELLRDAKQ